MTQKVLLIFIKNPEYGKVKTRLAATIGNKNALVVYKELLRFTRSITQDLPVKKMLFYADSINENDDWPVEKYAKFLQTNGDLGLKMQAAFDQAYSEGAQEVIIIGSDCYELTSDLIMEAFKALETADAVIGPAVDGGYYLMGFSRPNPTVFQNKNWSTHTVFPETINDLEKAGFRYVMLPVLNDVDEEKDLGELSKLL